MNQSNEYLSNIQHVQNAIAKNIKSQPFMMMTELVKKVRPILPDLQLRATLSTVFNSDTENDYFRATFLSYHETLKRLFATYQALPKYGVTAKTPILERIVYLHYFAGNSDWWILEKDTEEQDQNLAYGVISLHQQYPEIGNICFDDLVSSGHVTLDEHWQPKLIKDIKTLSDL